MKWVVADPNSWETRYEQLKQYKAEHGDCNVPMRKDDPQLGEWVGQQRKQYKLKKEGKKAPITDERIQKLDELDFAWQLRKRKRQNEAADGDGDAAQASADAQAAAESIVESLAEGTELPALAVADDGASQDQEVEEGIAHV